MERLKFAQDLIKTSNSSVASGFNMFIYGHDKPFHHEYHDHVPRIQGYEYAEGMAEKGEIAFTHKFSCKNCGDIPFQYGGFWVCNGCGGKDVDEEWWKIKVEKDGSAFCCHSLDFENHHITEEGYNNYAFGDTFKEAIKNYGELMIAKK